MVMRVEDIGRVNFCDFSTEVKLNIIYNEILNIARRLDSLEGFIGVEETDASLH